MAPKKRRCPSARPRNLATGKRQTTTISTAKTNNSSSSNVPTGKYSMLTAAAALARATAAHLSEALSECEQRVGYRSARELAPYVLDAHLLSHELARLAAREGGAP